MRKLFVISFLALSAIAYGRQISQREALDVASEFLNSSTVLQQVGKRNIQRPYGRDISTDNSQPYYVFNAEDNQGFVIVAGDDRLPCILGYSKTGSFNFDTLPPQLDNLLGQYLEWQKTIPADSPTHDSWKVSASPSLEEDILLETVNWGQGAPYNSQCPVIDGVQAPTGCVPTAMAIVMKYHGWPEKYDWNLMSELGTESGDLAISSLMKEIGEKTKTDYQAQVSNTYTGLVSQSLFQDFEYSHEAQMISLGSGHIGQAQWVDLIHNEIKQARPIIYVGTGGSEGHAFIVDGFDNNGLYHINWGWNGSYNGYYDLSALIPYDGANFSDGQGMVLSIKPGNGDDDKYSNTAYIDYGYLVGISCYHGLGLNPEVSDIVSNQPFYVSYATLNVKPRSWFGIALINKDNEIKEVLKRDYCAQDNADDDTGFIHYLGESIMTVTSEIEPTDKLHLIARESELSPWKLVRGTIETPSSQPVNGIECKLSHLNWTVPDGITIKYHHCDETFEGMPSQIAKGTLLDIYAYSQTPGTVGISINGNNSYQDISAWEFGAIGACASFYCLSDNMDIAVSFIPETSYLDISVETEAAGTIEQKVRGNDLSMIKGLTVKGAIDQRDFLFIRNNMHHLERLDLSNAKIYEYDRYQEDHLPEDALNGLSWLKKIVLPNIKVIETKALAGLNNLNDIEIPASVNEIQEDAFYYSPNLKRIVFKNSIPFKGTRNSLTDWFPYHGFIVVPEGSSEQYRQTPYAEKYRRILEGELIPATGIKLTGNNAEELESNVLMPLYCLSNNYNINLEPYNSTDYVIGGTSQQKKVSMDIYSNEEGLYCNLVSRATNGGSARLILNTSSGSTATYDIEAIPQLSDIRLEQETLVLSVGESRKLNFNVLPSQYPVSLYSSDPDVVSVDSTGTLYTNKEGSATVTATAADGSKTMSADCEVTVSKTTEIKNKFTDNEAHVKIYDLQGLLIFEGKKSDITLVPGYYIIVQGGKSAKVKFK